MEDSVETPYLTLLTVEIHIQNLAAFVLKSVAQVKCLQFSKKLIVHNWNGSSNCNCADVSLVTILNEYI